MRFGIHTAIEMQSPLEMNTAAVWSTEQHNSSEQHLEMWNVLKKTEGKIPEGRK